jgi:IclR family transcriptional regulator, mhp operon transcriptional activator
LAADRRGTRLSGVLSGQGAGSNPPAAAEFHKPDDRLAREPRRLEKILAETRQRGYGTRDPTFLGGHYGSTPFDDGLAAIAVPLLDQARVHGSINILWIKTAFTVEEFAGRHLADLQTAAREIVHSIQGPTKRQ